MFELVFGVFRPLREHPEIADAHCVEHGKRPPERYLERKQQGGYMLNSGLFLCFAGLRGSIWVCFYSFEREEKTGKEEHTDIETDGKAREKDRTKSKK